MSLLSKFRKTPSKMSQNAEIFEYICDLLNTKKAFGAGERDLGLDCYACTGSKNQITIQIIQDIKQCLEKFEKRIQLIDIQALSSENQFQLSFIISCKIENIAHSFQISFHRQQKFFNDGGVR